MRVGNIIKVRFEMVLHQQTTFTQEDDQERKRKEKKEIRKKKKRKPEVVGWIVKLKSSVSIGPSIVT